MRPTRSQRGYALIMAVIVILIVTVAAVGVIRFASREVAGSIAGRKEVAVASCAEAARSVLMGQWKLLGTHDTAIPPLKLVLESVTPTQALGGHYGQDPTDYYQESSQTWISNVQVIQLDPKTVPTGNQVRDISNSISDTVAPYRVVVHCSQGTPPDARELELEFGVLYGL
jgi:hypothetical protein